MNKFWEIYKSVAAWCVLIYLLCFFIFGGEFSTTIHFNSFSELLKHF